MRPKDINGGVISSQSSFSAARPSWLPGDFFGEAFGK